MNILETPIKMPWSGLVGRCQRCGTKVELNSDDRPQDSTDFTHGRNNKHWIVFCPMCKAAIFVEKVLP